MNDRRHGDIVSKGRRFPRGIAGLVLFASCVVPLAAIGAGAGDVAEGFAHARRLEVTGAAGVPLAVVEQGDRDAPTLVFIHGYRQSRLSWYSQFASDLLKRCHLVAYDLRGHGDSGAPWRSEDYDRSTVWATDLARVLEATHARRPLLVAWSFGGLVAMDYLRDPQVAIAGLVLVGSTGQLLPAAARPASYPPPSTLAERIAGATATTDRVYGPKVDAGIRALFAVASLRTGPFIDAATMNPAAARDNADLLPRVRALSTTLVNGTDDAIVPRAMTGRLQAALPGARIVDIAGSGHAPFVDAPEVFNALLEEIHCHPGANR